MYEIKGNDIEVVKGDTLIALIGVTKNDEDYMPQEGDVIRFALKRSYSDTECRIRKVVDPQTLLLRLEAAETKELSVGMYVYDVEITFANGDVDTFIRGNFKVLNEVD